MARIALIAAFLAAGWSPAAHCLATASGAKDTVTCHEGAAPKPAKAPMSDCAAMVCCQTVLLSAAVAAPAPESVPAPISVATLILVPPAPAAEFAPAAPPGHPGVLLAVSLLGRAPPAA